MFGLIGDVPDLVDALSEEPKDWLNVALKGTKCALDVAGVFPGVGAITGSLGVVVGTIDVVREGAKLTGVLPCSLVDCAALFNTSCH